MKKLLLSFISLSISLTSLAQNTLLVPSAYSTIQAAVNASVDGDTVLVSPGTYNETVSLNGKSIVLASLYLTTGDASYINSTIIDGTGFVNQDVLSIQNGEDSTTYISGFTITSATVYSPQGRSAVALSASSQCTLDHLIITGITSAGRGAGIFVNLGAKATIQFCRIENNTSNLTGGGIIVENSELHLINSVVKDNVSQNGNGGGIGCVQNAMVIISCSKIEGNSAPNTAFHGGGLFSGGAQFVSVENSVFTNNEAGAGGGIYTNDSLVVVYTEIANNRSFLDGGGMAPSGSPFTFVQNASIVNNSADRDGPDINVAFGQQFQILNSILTSPIEVNSNNPPVVTVSYCNLPGGQAGIGNIDFYSQFVDSANGDFRLMTGSPCVDAGDPSSLYNDPDGSRNDLGAYPINPSSACRSSSLCDSIASLTPNDTSLCEDNSISLNASFTSNQSLCVTSPVIYDGNDNFFLVSNTTDGAKNMYRTGSFNGSIAIGDTSFSTSATREMFVVKYDSCGQFIWSIRSTSSSQVSPRDIVSDDQGNLYVCGGYDQPFSFTDIAGNVTSFNHGGSGDGFLVKISSSGVILWSLTLRGGGYDEWFRINIDNAGEVLLVGTFNGCCPAPDNTSIFANGSQIPIGTPSFRSGVVAKFTSNGTYQWHGIIYNRDASVTAVETDAVNNVYVSGHFRSGGGIGAPLPVIVDANFNSSVISNPGSGRAFLAKFSPQGQLQWETDFGNNGDGVNNLITAQSMEYAADNNVWIVGEYTGPAITFNSVNGLPTNQPAATGQRSYVVGYSVNGDVVTSDSYQYQTGQNTMLYAIENLGDTLYVGGYAEGGGLQNKDALVRKLDYGLNELDITTAGGPGDDVVYDIHQIGNSVNISGAVAAGATIEGITSSSDAGFLWTKDAVTTPQVSYLWSTGSTTSSIVVSPSQTTTYSVTMSDGITTCVDSTTISVNTVYRDTIYIIACDSFLWARSGVVYNVSGLYSDSLTSQSGCDSITWLNLTINSPSVDLGADTISFCNSSTTLDAGPGYGSYLWSTGETTQTINVGSSGMYTVTVEDSISVVNDHSMSFDGVDDEVICSNPIASNSQFFSLMIDVKMLDTNYAVIVSDWPGGGATFKVDAFSNGNFMRFDMNTSDGFFSCSAPIDTTTDLNTWVNWSFTYDGAFISIYKNGSFESSIPCTGLYNPSSTNLLFGEESNNSAHFNGLLDNCHIWNLPLTVPEIQAYVTCPPIGDENGLIGFWNFEEGIGNVTNDLSFNVNNGQIGGASWSTDVPNQSCGACTANDSVYVDLFEFVINPQDTTICEGDSVTLSAGLLNLSIPISPLAACTLSASLSVGLSGAWPFCGNAIDETGNGNNGTVSGASLVAGQSGIPNTAYYFDGVNDYISLSAPFFQGGNNVQEFSYATLFKVDDLPAAGQGYRISGKEGYWRTITLNITSDGQVSFTGSQPNPNSYFGVNSPNNTIVPGQWHTVIVRFENSLLELFVDNVLVGSSLLNFSGFDFFWLANGNSTSTNHIGAIQPVSTGVTSHFNGVIDDFRTWDRALTNNEVLALSSTSFESLVYQWSTGDTTASISVSPSQTTTYSVTVSNGISSCTDSVTVSISNPSIDLGADTIRSCDSATTLDAGPGYGSYLWSTGEITQTIDVDSSGMYSVTVGDSLLGCTATDSVYVDLFEFLINPEDTTICEGDSVVLSIQGSVSDTTQLPRCNLPPTLLNGLVAFYPFCGNANDESGNGNDGIVNGATLTTDRFGNADNAYFFPGSCNVSIDANVNTSSINGQLSFSIWVLREGSGCIGPRYFEAWPGSNSLGHFQLAWDNSFSYPEGVTHRVNGGNGPNGLSTATFDNVSNNVWTHIVYVNDGVNAYLYQDGVLKSTGVNPTGSAVTLASDIAIGRMNHPAFDAINGKVDDVAIWNRALSPSEVSQLSYSTLTSDVFSYQWSTGDTTASIEVRPMQTTIYSVIGTDGIVTCSDSVTVNIIPTIRDTILTVSCDSFIWNGQSYTATGLYLDTFISSQGCDSIATLDLTINQTQTSTEAQVACDSFIWNGQTYTATGLYVDTFISSQGCDSIATLDLTINQTQTSTETQVACDSFIWNGQTYNATGLYLDTFISSQGCDSIATLNLTINQTQTSTETQVACDSFIWNGQTYNATGLYTNTFVSSNGCDSIATLDLTINQTQTSTETQVACDSFTWNGQTYNVSGIYTETFVSAVGCDSIVSLDITIHPSYLFVDSIIIDFELVWEGQVLRESGDYEVTYTTSEDCDSIYLLNLVIERPVLSLPTAFSPNGDGVNDFFKPVSYGEEDIILEIFNRWGEMVYREEGRSNMIGWDGTYKGDNVPMETYVYTIRYVDYGGNERFLQGNITLIR